MSGPLCQSQPKDSSFFPEVSTLLGEQFICEDDDFSQTPTVTKHYAQLPQKGRAYTLHEVHLGFDAEHQPAYAGNFVELPLVKPGGGFFLGRFRPLDDALASILNPTAEHFFGVVALKSFDSIPEHLAELGITHHPRTGQQVSVYVSKAFMKERFPSIHQKPAATQTKAQ
jgi:hypothetical protein